MLDLAGFRGLLPGSWDGIPSVLYFHESQMTYPGSPQMEPDLSFAFTNWTSAVSARAVVFNSDYHRGVFFEELPRLLRHFPDHRHEHLVDAVRSRSNVVPVGVDLTWVRPLKGDPPLVMWNHRWEHDKNPAEFLTALRRVAGRREFRVALCGENFGNDLAEFAQVRDVLGERLIQFGHAPRERYRQLLNGADVIVSTALQEFFGVSVVESVAAGAFPVLPRRLSYPELIPQAVHDAVFFEEGELVEALDRALDDSALRRRVTDVTSPAMRRFEVGRVSRRMDEVLVESTDSTNTAFWPFSHMS
jgi:glycosyltransferase involved in cell wall biosynthesis